MEKVVKIISVSILVIMILGFVWLVLDHTFGLTPSKIVTVVDEDTGFTYKYNENSLNRMVGNFIDFSKVAIGIEAVLVFILAKFKHTNNEIKKRNALIIFGLLLVFILLVGFVLSAPMGSVTAD